MRQVVRQRTVTSAASTFSRWPWPTAWGAGGFPPKFGCILPQILWWYSHVFRQYIRILPYSGLIEYAVFYRLCILVYSYVF